MSMTTAKSLPPVQAAHLLQIGVLALLWGCNWPVLKLGVSHLAPLTFRAASLPFAALGLLLISRLYGDSLKIPPALWPRLLVLTLLNVTGWNTLILFGVKEMAAGRSAIIAYTLPMWGVLFSLFLLHEPLSRRKLTGLALGMAGMAVLLGDDIAALGRSPKGTLMILGAAMSWGMGTVLLRLWKPAVPQATLTGWMMLLGWLPIALAAPFCDPHPLTALAHMDGTEWFAVLYNIFFAGTISYWIWFRMARTLPVAVSGLSSLPVPVVGVVSGMLILGERPGLTEFIALGLVLASLGAVLFAPSSKPDAVAAPYE
jgi:drug/metabolite transporter (DMT)-like permease